MSPCYVPYNMPGLKGSTSAPKDGLWKLLLHRVGLRLGHSYTHIAKVLSAGLGLSQDLSTPCQV